MFLICLLSVSLIAIAIINQQAFSTTEQEEYIPVPVRVDQTKNSGY
ncbi:MAG: hypothetical protein AAGE84_27920 [Cyanobacteria bacterium P01_G01_bin.39]